MWQAERILFRILLFYCLINSCAKRQTDATPPRELAESLAEIRRVEEKIKGKVGQNNLLDLDALHKMAQEYDSGTIQRHVVDQYMVNLLANLGEHTEALKVRDQSRPKREYLVSELLPKSLKPKSALQAIVEASQNHQIVILNEAHHVVQHRVLTHQLLPALRRLGFNYFAAETLDAADRGLAERGYPTAETGYYLQEPLYADIVRQALRIGFQVVAYEPRPGPSPAEREIEQAHNLQKIFELDPEAKILVHVGYSHNREEPGGFDGAGAMAYNLKQITGLDPLTIDQITMSERGRSDLEHPLYIGAIQDGQLGRNPVVFSDGASAWSLPGAGRDITVFHPRTEWIKGRPHWLSFGGARRWVDVESSHCPVGTACLVEAFVEREGEDALPMDRLMMTGGDPASLVLPQGKFRVRIRDRQGVKLGEYLVVTEMPD